MAADLHALAEVAHAADVPLVVDQSWGPHFGFHDALPPTALSQGADAMLTSTHKIAGSLTQSAMLHVGSARGGGRIDVGAVARAVRLLRSTSPSSLLLASLDSARRQLVLHGEQLLHETLEAIAVARAKLETIPGIALVDASLVGRMGVAGYDPLRIVVDVRGTGCTGYEIADALRRSYDVHLELPTAATLVFIVGLGESATALRRLAGDIEETVKRVARPGTTAAIVGPMATLRNEMAVPPREAFLGETEQLLVDDAVGRISCESIASYPPGVPALLPGERISAETVAYLRELAAGGARLHGASDPRFRTINVLRESGR
jgi:arginine/lysine/ornithine decarboxylase